jgi:hypothetical protein
MRPYEKLHARWREQGYSGGRIRNDVHVPLEECGFPFPDEAQLMDIEQRCGLKIPADLREHLLHVPLTGEGIDGGGEMVLFWSAGEVCTVAERFARSPYSPWWNHPGHPETYLIFCDYLISCWEWAIVCAPGPDYGRIALMAGPNDELFAYGSFSEMVDDYVASGDVDFAHRGIGTLKAE